VVDFVSPNVENWTCKALNGLFCADVPLSNSLTYLPRCCSWSATHGVQNVELRWVYLAPPATEKNRWLEGQHTWRFFSLPPLQLHCQDIIVVIIIVCHDLWFSSQYTGYVALSYWLMCCKRYPDQIPWTKSPRTKSVRYRTKSHVCGFRKTKEKQNSMKQEFQYAIELRLFDGRISESINWICSRICVLHSSRI